MPLTIVTGSVDEGIAIGVYKHILCLLVIVCVGIVNSTDVVPTVTVVTATRLGHTVQFLMHIVSAPFILTSRGREANKFSIDVNKGDTLVPPCNCVNHAFITHSTHFKCVDKAER